MTIYGRHELAGNRVRSFEVQPEYLTIFQTVYGQLRRYELAGAVARYGCYGEEPDFGGDIELQDAFETIQQSMVVGPWKVAR